MSHDYRSLLAEKLDETHGRQTYNATEVRDILLDLWNALKADEAALLDELPELQPA